MLRTDQRQNLQSYLQQAIKGKVFPGCVLGIVNKQNQREIITVGHHTYDKNSPHTTSESIFDIASLTKVIPTSLVTLQLWEQGVVDLENKIIDYLPELQSTSGQKATIRHLLTYTYILKLSYPLAALVNEDPEHILKLLFTTETVAPPGRQFCYTNTPSILLGLILEKVVNKRLPDIATERLFEPLKMHSTSFQIDRDQIEHVVPTEIDPRGIVQGFVHDESSWALQKSFFPGCAGVFSNVNDILNVVAMFLKPDPNHRFLKESTLSIMETNQLESIGSCHGLGIELNQPFFMGTKCSTKAIGKTGFTGTSFVLDRQKGIGFVLLSNRTYPTRPKDGIAINSVRQTIADMIWEYC